MNKHTFIPTLALGFMLMACGHSSDKNNLVIIDVEATYPEKELVLQDFVDVEYIALETTDEFINKGFVKAVGKKFIATVNGGTDGNIYLYERSTGKAIRKINRKGQGGEEYSQITRIVLNNGR